MQRILIERARRKARLRHGGGRARVDLDPALAAADETTDHVALREALEQLERELPRAAQIVMLRFYAGLNDDVIAEILGVSARTVRRDWRFAKAWLVKTLDPDGDDQPADVG